METMLKEDQEEAGRWLGLLALLVYLVVGVAVKNWPIEQDFTDAGLGCIDCLDSADDVADDCGE